MAVSLLKSCYAQRDYLAENYRLHYLRTENKQEVDFALVKNTVVEKIIEAKNANSDVDKNLYMRSKKYNLPAIQVIKNLKLERKPGDTKIVKALNFMKQLYL